MEQQQLHTKTNPPWTVAFWIYPTTGGDSSQAVIGTDINWYSIKLKQADGKLGTTKSSDDSFGESLSNDTWHHVVVVSTGSEVKLYVNGVYNSNLTTTSATTLGLPLHKLGYVSTSADKLSARLDELLIYPIALSDYHVTSLYNSY